MHEYATLNGREVVPTDDVRVAFSRENRPPKVGDDMVGEVHVSTVFLRLNHGWGGVPQWFETMIFGGEHDGWCERYETYDQAEAGHKRTVDALKSGQSPDNGEVPR